MVRPEPCLDDGRRSHQALVQVVVANLEKWRQIWKVFSKYSRRALRISRFGLVGVEIGVGKWEFVSGQLTVVSGQFAVVSGSSAPAADDPPRGIRMGNRSVAALPFVEQVSKFGVRFRSRHAPPAAAVADALPAPDQRIKSLFVNLRAAKSMGIFGNPRGIYGGPGSLETCSTGCLPFVEQVSKLGVRFRSRHAPHAAAVAEALPAADRRIRSEIVNLRTAESMGIYGISRGIFGGPGRLESRPTGCLPFVEQVSKFGAR
jgi:hypothetical protein